MREFTQDEIDAMSDDADDEHVTCWNCGGEGEIEDEDWQFEGEFYTCDICEGKGGWPRVTDQDSAAEPPQDTAPDPLAGRDGTEAVF